jgi:hypothetical protein
VIYNEKNIAPKNVLKSALNTFPITHFYVLDRVQVFVIVVVVVVGIFDLHHDLFADPNAPAVAAAAVVVRVGHVGAAVSVPLVFGVDKGRQIDRPRRSSGGFVLESI